MNEIAPIEKEAIAWCAGHFATKMDYNFLSSQGLQWIVEAVTDSYPIEFGFKDDRSAIGMARFELFCLRVEKYLSREVLINKPATNFMDLTITGKINRQHSHP